MKKIFWTEHSKIKMRQYGLSQGKILQVLRRPERQEKGIAPGCTALMQTNRGPTRKLTQKNAERPWLKRAPGEIWLMYKDNQNIRKIISAWRYPGISKPGESIPIPAEIKQELLNGDL
ncbi:MAG TPA: hypothetical protein VI937_02455 [Negativicutes bacterium]|uniref:Uncharacterized protein n=1 Tax=Candidatus Staskawiczbacteria bacterium RIFCSPHIGHO2_01_FULL_41_41 TaxID=1802203 RepID=A0A1G2HUY0_9BACT|nr:MAG: hypothetical protein A2822_02215 [Candidatus Staskawiczbacteria bacterium RIFCSPHIGHO2_01_FULL_41_41]OGZ69139.1 MAG: hypothetical protein A3C50_01955 [Candidatus Staskawiczbacteria bacterium RIFCSPHIGHO2_02_FULL_43_16]OGZ74433.1 MAG: hypothetical protein A3A12_01535 [Candidatus Staskawiczbacteria bacterium RIFCSPLOWO2_01_FULL_43_17b]HLD70718.1 hypothetical protein [Negativicutes bacterium]